MTPAKKRFDKRSPEAKALRDEIVHGTFVKEGTMVAFPTCFPGATVPIAAEESHITALAANHAGVIYGGTSGRASHLFVGMFHGVTGVVFDLGAVEDSDQCVAVCCGRERLVACANGPAGGRVLARAFEPLPFDLIQEWWFTRTPFEELGAPVPGERIVHAVADPAGSVAVGTTEGHLFTVDVDTGQVNVVGQVTGKGRLVADGKGVVLGLDDDHALWRYDVGTGKLERNAIPLPKGSSWNEGAARWARDPGSGHLYVADDAGRLYSLHGDGFSGPLAQTSVAPVGAMAATLDGRLFGLCGQGIASLFCYHPGRQELSNLGAAVSVIERRRYGYVFADAVTGRDGEIVFAEDDDLGHVWLYFPRIEPS